MTQLQQAPRRVTYLTAGFVAFAAAAVILVTIVLGMLIPTRVSVPSTGIGEGYSQPNPALVEAERQWQLQREQQGGFSDPLTQAEREWERQRQQQSSYDENRIMDARIQAERAWEEQRKQQSAFD
jgi:hypothetical protein